MKPRSTSLLLVSIILNMLFNIGCTTNNKSLDRVIDYMVIGGPVSNYAVIENDTLYEGGWDTGLRIHNIQGDTVVYDCLHYFESICTRWCDNAHTDSNSFLFEFKNRAEFSVPIFYCLKSFKVYTERTDTSFLMNSQFEIGDTTFYQKSFWRSKNYWPIE